MFIKQFQSIQYNIYNISSASFNQSNKIFTRTLMPTNPVQYLQHRPLLKSKDSMADTIVEGTTRRGRCSTWVDASVGHGGGGGAVWGGGRITRCGRIRSRWRLDERHRQVTAAAMEHRGVAAAESPDAGGSARDGASVGHGGRGNRRGRWNATGWRRWSCVGRLSNRRMQEDPLKMFRVIIIG
jgi:hypothetical protein